MIDKLFSMHNIKYVISVDDCYFARKREGMEATVYSELCKSLEPFEAILSSSNQAEVFDSIHEMLELETDTTVLIRELVERLEFEDLQKCYEVCEESGAIYSEERNGIIAFLEGLKSNGQIHEYLTFPSTEEANLFDARAAGMTNGSILWLLDRNFARIGESPEAGLTLAENLVKRTDGIDNYIYILSAVDADACEDEDDIEIRFDTLLAGNCSADTRSFIYYINKQRILDNNSNKIAKSLSQGFKRKACFELFQLYTDCLSVGLTDALTTIQEVRQKTLNYIYSDKIQKNGESYTDFARRFVQLFHYDGYNNAVAQKYSEIASKAKYYESLCSVISDAPGNVKELTGALKKYREIELYNRHVNKQRCEVATGDIFEVDGSFYLLVSQSCDTYLRKTGKRKIQEATLLEIADDGTGHKYSYPLPCFLTMRKPAVIYHSLKIFPFDILDLCTINTSGNATVSIKDISEFEEELKLYTANFRLRFGDVLERLNKVHTSRTLLQRFWAGSSLVSAEEAYKAHVMLDDINPNLKKYDFVENQITYNVKRICRLTELTTIDIIRDYGNMLSRIGQPFDFAGNSHE